MTRLKAMFIFLMLIFFLIGILDMLDIIAISGSFLTPMVALLGVSIISGPEIKKTGLNKILCIICVIVFVVGSIIMFININTKFVAALQIFTSILI